MVHAIQKTEISHISEKSHFLIDTNVLLSIHYGACVHQWSAKKKQVYSTFIGDLLKRGNPLHVSALNLQEVCHVVEKTQFKLLYGSVNGSLKRFRRNNTERKKLQYTLENIFTQIQELYDILPDSVTERDVNDYVANYSTHIYDPIDYFVVDHNCTTCMNIVTDDRDFHDDGRINVYTYQY